MDDAERNDPFFQGVHDATYEDAEPSTEPPKKRRKKAMDADEAAAAEAEAKRKVAARAELEMMMATDEVHGAYDVEDNEQPEDEVLAKRLDKRIKRNWKLRWLIKKAVRRKLAEQDQFKFDDQDKRFGALTEDPDFALDPNNTGFRDTDVMKQLLRTT